MREEVQSMTVSDATVVFTIPTENHPRQEMQKAQRIPVTDPSRSGSSKGKWEIF